MKVIKKFTALLMVIVLSMSLLVLAACPGEEGPDPERRPLTMSLQNPDGLFNPFFSTSAMDSEVIGMTQISMLSSDKEGKVLCGDNEPSVVKSYTIKEEEIGGKKYTDYTFVIKNGILFSDGQPLTIKDVLFNLYVYLDPVYTGSATVYSTDIVGLQKYRQQEENVTDDASAFEQRFVEAAYQHIDDVVEFVQAFSDGYQTNSATGQIKPDPNRFKDSNGKILAKYLEDFVYVAKEFRNELESDWNNADADSYANEGFDSGIKGKWEVFLMNEGIADFYKKDEAGERYLKDKDGNKIFDPSVANEMEKNELDAWLAANQLEKNNQNIKQWALDLVYSGYLPLVEMLNGKPYSEEMFSESNLAQTLAKTNANEFEKILRYWMTASTVLTQFTANAKSEQLGANKKIPTVEGITSSLDVEEKIDGCDVLKIRINGVDPKAIWNFAFTVAPMHYYSSSSYQGKDYIGSFDAKKGEFGFKFADKDFFDKVINAPSKVGLPVGAGVYKASTVNGGTAKNGGEFYDNNIIYYERNDNFYTVFGTDSSKNAKIKYFRYKVVETEQIINAIANGDIDIGDPNATPKNIQWLDQQKIAHEEVMTSGYGYVGINPRFVKDVHVRRAIIKAMNTQLIKDNYYQNLCELINRPMSKASWAYPKDAAAFSTTYTYQGKSYPVSYKYDSSGLEIEQLLESVGYKKVNGIYQKEINGKIEKLSYKFTIAGSSTDHPAYSMFVQAADLLNKHGFDIKVVTSQQALSDLSAGKLTVWAAAWSSTIDPDMYQVYHKDSNASSVNNWGYPQIKADQNLYRYEYNLIQRLSTLIDDGRATTSDDARKTIYGQALDLVMELAVEFPTYQRNDMTAYNESIIDRSTMTAKKELSPYNGLLSRIWELNYVK